MVEEYESDTETIEDWEEWNTNLLNFFIFKINIVDGIDVTKINISWASWSCCFSHVSVNYEFASKFNMNMNISKFPLIFNIFGNGFLLGAWFV